MHFHLEAHARRRPNGGPRPLQNEMTLRAERTPREVMVAFIDQHRDVYGVEPICAQLPIAPSMYFLHKAQQADPTARSARAQRDDELRVEIQRVWDANQQVYGATQGVAPAAARAGPRRALTVAPIDAGARPGVNRPRSGLGHHHARRSDRLAAAGSRGPAVYGHTSQCALGLGLHLRGDVGRFCVCRLRHRRLCSAHRRLARLGIASHGLRADALEKRSTMRRAPRPW